MALGATTRCICLRFGLVDCDGPATYFGAVQLGDGLLGIPVDRHFNEAKPLGLTGIYICRAAVNRPKRLFIKNTALC